MFKLAVFDMDGTLLDTVHDLASAGNYALCQSGLPVHDVDAYKYFAGNGAHNLVLRAMAPVSDADSVTRVEAAFHAHYADHAEDHTKPYDGISQALAQLRQHGVRLAVLSNKPHAYTKELAEQYFPGLFDMVYGQRDGIPIKPDPAALLEILQLTGYSPKDCVYIGDTAVDIETGHNGGMSTIGVLWGFRTRNELEEAGADVIINKCADLVKVVVDK